MSSSSGILFFLTATRLLPIRFLRPTKNIIFVCEQQQTFIIDRRTSSAFDENKQIPRTSFLFASNNERSSSTEEHHLLLTKASKPQEHLCCLQSTTKVISPPSPPTPHVNLHGRRKGGVSAESQKQQTTSKQKLSRKTP